MWNDRIPAWRAGAIRYRHIAYHPGTNAEQFFKPFFAEERESKIEFDKGMPPEMVASGIIHSLRTNGPKPPWAASSLGIAV